MIVLIGLVILVAAVVVGVAGVLTNGGGHPLTDQFAVFGYHVTGSTGVLFLYGIVVGAVGVLGLSLLLAGARRTARRGRTARRDLKQSRRETAAVSQDRGPRRRAAARDPGDRHPGEQGRPRGHGGRPGPRRVPGRRRASGPVRLGAPGFRGIFGRGTAKSQPLGPSYSGGVR